MLLHNLIATLIAAAPVMLSMGQTAVSEKVNAPGKIIKKGKLVYSEVTIRATPEKVWSVFSAFQDYPAWNPFIKSIEGTPKVGGKIKAFLQPPHSKGMTFHPKVLVYDAGKELRWIGKLSIPRLFDGEHTFQIIDHHDGTVTFRQYERFRGILIPLFKKMLDNDTKTGFDLMNEKLKELCEK